MTGFATAGWLGLGLALASLGQQPPGALAQAPPTVPAPATVLGFRPGEDNRLAPWSKLVECAKAIDDASDRVAVRELGTTTEGRPMIVAIVSSADTIRDLDRHQALQRTVALPGRPGGETIEDEAARSSKVVVLITCTIHSTETASALMAVELLHDLATGDDPATREVLDNTILLLVPSVNPDGIDIVAEWYERSRGTPWEGSGLPRLYHKYAGHDTNRDWFMLNLAETKMLTQLLYKEWFPTITYDVHQMGSKGARLFVPPFHDPINPNLDPRVSQSIAVIGAHMASDLATAGKKGVLTGALYDNWWNGGNRTTPQRHNMVGVLTEAASVRMASPIFLEDRDLGQPGRGFTDHKPAVNFVDPWPGGWWRLRDIVDYEKICARSLLTLAARYRTSFQKQYLDMGRSRIAEGRSRPPFAWVVPANQDDPNRAGDMVRILMETGIEAKRSKAAFTASGATFPAGSWVLPADQPYRLHLKDMMERQVYPDRLTATGAAETPYDVAGWTLPLQMGVRGVPIDEKLPADLALETVATVEPVKGRIEGRANPTSYVLPNRTNGELSLIWKLAGAGAELRLAREPVATEGRRFESGAIWMTATPAALAALERHLPGSGAVAFGTARVIEGGWPGPAIAPRRIGVYQPWVPSMDEGWTRLVLENLGVPYVTLHDADVRAGGLRDRLDAILVPSIDARTLRSGHATNQTEPAYVGGLGAEGSAALKAFVETGGVLVCLEESCRYAISELALPVREVLGGLKSSEFYGPGSIVRVEGRQGAWLPVLAGMPAGWSAYFDRSLAFASDDSKNVPLTARYALSSPLESGWLLGPTKLEGQGAIAEVPRGSGRVVLFGFPPQHRGQTAGTFRLMVNALALAGLER
jgi:hypothetical protein